MTFSNRQGVDRAFGGLVGPRDGSHQFCGMGGCLGDGGRRRRGRFLRFLRSPFMPVKVCVEGADHCHIRWGATLACLTMVGAVKRNGGGDTYLHTVPMRESYSAYGCRWRRRGGNLSNQETSGKVAHEALSHHGERRGATSLSRCIAFSDVIPRGRLVWRTRTSRMAWRIVSCVACAVCYPLKTSVPRIKEKVGSPCGLDSRAGGS